MNIPLPTWLVIIVVNNKIIQLQDYIGISSPSYNEIVKLANDMGYKEFTDWATYITNNGRN